MKYQLDTYNSTGKLPTHPYLPCVSVACESKTTCFGKNLESKIKGVGSLEQLLSEFKCRVCRTGNTSSKVKVGSHIKKTKRITKSATRAAFVRDLIHNAPKMDFTPRKPVSFLRDSPETVRSITLNGSCIRPDIFLDSGRKCDDCCYISNCQSSVKTLSKEYKILAS